MPGMLNELKAGQKLPLTPSVVLRTQPASAEHPDDPQKGRWGGQPVRNGRELIADEIPDSDTWFRVSLHVRESESGEPLRGNVIFHLHDTFDPVDREVPVIEGQASLSLYAYGAFTVGAEADNGRTHLELDLAHDPSVPARFRTL